MLGHLMDQWDPESLVLTQCIKNTKFSVIQNGLFAYPDTVAAGVGFETV